MQSHRLYLERSIEEIVEVISSVKGTIYMTGIGKSAHVVRKCVATWQSLSLPAHFLLAQDLLHGDIGVVRPDDILIYISNSGNTEELIGIAKHVRDAFGVYQLSISNNPSATLGSFVNKSICISEKSIREADPYDKIPTVSSLLFMMTLDTCGLLLAEKRDFTDEVFRRNHPSGNVHTK
jgi:arabinose-5-phosphate isomerase